MFHPVIHGRPTDCKYRTYFFNFIKGLICETRYLIGNGNWTHLSSYFNFFPYNLPNFFPILLGFIGKKHGSDRRIFLKFFHRISIVLQLSKSNRLCPICTIKKNKLSTCDNPTPRRVFTSGSQIRTPFLCCRRKDSISLDCTFLIFSGLPLFGSATYQRYLQTHLLDLVVATNSLHCLISALFTYFAFLNFSCPHFFGTNS